MAGVDNLSSSGQTLFVFCIVSLAILWPAIVLRVYIRLKIVKVFGADDWLMLVALVCYTWLAAADIGMALQGYGDPDLSMQGRYEAAKFEFFSQLAYYTVVTFARLSVCCFYLRITPIRWQRWLIYLIGLVNIVMALSCFLNALLLCQPVSYNWTQWLDKNSGSCHPLPSTPGLGSGQNMVSALSDFFLSLLPLLLLKDSAINLRLKLIVIGLLGIGVVSGVSAVIRFVNANKVTHSTPDSFIVETTTWSAIEPFCCILAATIATYRPLFRKMIEGVTKYRSTHRSQNPSSDRSWNAQKTHQSTVTSSQRAVRMGRLQPLESKSDVNLVLQDLGSTRTSQRDVESNYS